MFPRSPGALSAAGYIWTDPTGLPGGASLSKGHRRWAPDRLP